MWVISKLSTGIKDEILSFCYNMDQVTESDFVKKIRRERQIYFMHI